MATPTIDTFLTSISAFLRTRNDLELRAYLLVEPPLPQIYATLTAELRQTFPAGSGARLEQKSSALLPEDLDRMPDDERGTSWPAFITFAKDYLEYIRDVNFENLLETHQLLSAVTNQCITALSHSSLGLIVFPTCLSLSAALAKLAVSLEKRPELTAHLVTQRSSLAGAEDSDSKGSLVEGTAELLQRGFTICLTDRTPGSNGLGRDGRPEGKKIGIYKFANLVLKLLFQCRRTRLASQIFTNISQQSPPLSAFPAAQRVTYLYYLGRFAFSTNHFYRAQILLQEALNQCHRDAFQQRRQILLFLISSNIILGRFPTQALFERERNVDLAPKFLPICTAIARGDLAGFRESLKGKHESWFLGLGILLPLLNRGEPLVWRCLARRTYLLNGVPGGQSRRAPTFSLDDFLQLAQYFERRSLDPSSQSRDGKPVGSQFNSAFMAPFVQAPKPLPPIVDPEFEGALEERPDSDLPGMVDIESILVSLIDQGLLHGFLSHKLRRFAILGSKTKGALIAGFPNVWNVVQAHAESRGESQTVPGWVQDNRGTMAAAAGGPLGAGRVVNLSGARPAGFPA